MRDGAAEKAGFSSNDEWLGVEWAEGGKRTVQLKPGV